MKSLKLMLCLSALSLGAVNIAVAAEPHEGKPKREMRHHRMMERSEARYDQADANKDGVVSRAEFIDNANQRFNAVDANNDGQMTKEEIKAMRKAKKEEHRARMKAAREAYKNAPVPAQP